MDFHKELNTALKDRKTIVFSGECEVTYQGRAEAFLPKGDRVFIIKPDSTLLIHQPQGSSPVNYMKAETTHVVVKEESATYLKSTNDKLKEQMDIKIHKFHFFNSEKLNDEQKLTLVGTEKDMSDHIFNNPTLISDDFKPLSREEHTKYGFIDVFGHDNKGNLVIIECKRYAADLSAVTQLRRYVEKIKKAKDIEKVNGILAAPKITPNAMKMLTDWGYEFREITPPKRLKRTKDQKKLGEF